MRHFDTHELAWAAGLFDGEGCTTFQVNHSGRSSREWGLPKVSIGQKDRGVLDRFHQAVGVGEVAGPYKNGRGQHFQFRANRWADAQTVISLLWNWLSPIKRQQAYDVFSRYREQRRTRPCKNQPRKELTWEIVRAIRADWAAGLRHCELMRKYGISSSQVWKIVNFQLWKENPHAEVVDAN